MGVSRGKSAVNAHMLPLGYGDYGLVLVAGERSACLSRTLI